MFEIDLQFFSSDSILVSPVTEENATTVTIYLLKDKFYDFATLASVEGTNENVTLTNVNFTTTLVHTRGGTVLPLRKTGAMTTTELRTKGFEFVVAPDANGTAAGAPFADNCVSIVQVESTSTEISFAKDKLCVQWSFAFHVGVEVASVVFLIVENAPRPSRLSNPRKDNMPPSSMAQTRCYAYKLTCC